VRVAGSIFFPHLQPRSMQSTTGPDGGSQARIIYHTPGKSFAWLHKGPQSILATRKFVLGLTIPDADGSFADFQKALRLRLNVSKNEPLVIKQIDGDYTLDIETGPLFAGQHLVVLC
jgi:hypothetical protein